MKQKGKVFYGWWVLAACFVIMTFLYAPIANLISLFTVPVTNELGIGRTAFTSYFSVMAFVGMLTAPIAGNLMKKMGFKLYLTVFTLLGAISYFGFSYATSITHFIIFAIPMGMSLSGAAMIPVSVLITNWFVEKRGLSLGIALSGTGFGGMILSPLVTWLISNYGWRTAYFTIGVLIAVLIIPLVLFVIKLSPADKGLLPLGDAETVQPDQPKELTGISQKEAFKSVSFWVLCVGILVAAIVVNSMIVHFVPYLTDIGTTPEHAALLLSLASGMLIVTKLLVGRFFDKLGAIVTVLIVCAGSIVGFLFLLKANLLIPGIMYTILNALGATAVTVAPAFLTAFLYGEKEYSAKYGTVALFNSLGVAITPIVSGFIYNINHSYNLLINTLIVLAVVEFILLFIAIKKRPTLS
ncbi:MFS transporter [Bacillus sp. S/N-304-OC-R1]|uniref:MFS transporter n=1 Tax=Bacillus sp. S/N-304-OC-R1 TaxID=2758034 RepID=UPI001C8DE615|nr:MFS transporter [Bacillus sp. S/N-304-OC-R1]MBY0121497.1 MFS transporter [Bacillus sp. S/N-304-OC-R1]